MSKLYYPTPDELQGAKPLWEGGWGCDDNRGSWFHIYQELLVRLANTDYGRDLLCIDKLPYPVIAVRKNMIQFDLSRDLGPGYALADVRTGVRWGDLIRYRWLAVKKALDQMNLRILLELPKYIIHEGRSIPILKGAVETAFYPDAHAESVSVDGDLTHLADNVTWSDLYDGPADAVDDGAALVDLILDSDAGSNRWDFLSRAFILFDTSALTAGATITAGTFQFVIVQRTDDFSERMVLVSSDPNSNTALQADDWTDVGSASMANRPLIGSYTVDSSTYNAMTLNSDPGLGAISKTSITKFGLRMNSDNDNSPPSWSGDGRSHLGMASADTDLGSDKRLKLVLTYTLPFTPRAIMF